MKSPVEIISTIHKSLANGIRSGKAEAPRKWLEENKLSIEISGAVFNSGQLHHRKEQIYIDDLVTIGFLKQSPVGTNTGKPGYTIFAPHSILFPLKNKHNHVINWFGVHIINGKKQYLNNQGIYPNYPNPNTKRVYITKDPIDAASLMETRILDNREAVIALHDGILLDQHLEAIQTLTELIEIVCIL